MLKELIIFLICTIVLIKAAQYAIVAVTRLSRAMRMTEFVTSFLVVAIVSAFPETFIAIWSALTGDTKIGAGTLLGSNIADLTLILGLVGLAGHPIKVHSMIVKKDLYFIFLVILPILLGLNGVISRLDGVILILVGLAFIYTLLREREYFHKPFDDGNHWLKNLGILILSVLTMLIASHFIVDAAHSMAIELNIPSLIIGLVLVALGTTLPEFTFSIKAVKEGHSDSALGDLLGVVVVDACIVMGIIAIISPFTVDLIRWSVIGVFTLFAIIFAIAFMKTDNTLTKNESYSLILFYIAFVVAQILLR